MASPAPTVIPAALEVKASALGRGWVRALLTVLGLIPRRAREAFAEAVGTVVYHLGIRRRVALENLAEAYPELTEPERRTLARGAYRSMARSMVEALFPAVGLGAEELRGMLASEDWKRMAAALAQGKGVLLATAHLGNWELFGDILLHQGIPLAAVVRPLKGALNAVLMENRARRGLQLIPPSGAITGTVKALKQGACVAILTDQSIPARHAFFVPFFGRLAATAPALSMAARRSGAPVMVTTAPRVNGKYQLHLEGPIEMPSTGNLHQDLQQHTANVTAALERLIRRHPDQWLWLHRRWKERPPQSVPGSVHEPEREPVPR